jgi:mono/diheme cytochrome c family protein
VRGALIFWALLSGMTGTTCALAAQGVRPTLVLTIGGESRQFDAATLLARADTTSLTVEHDISYRRPMTYRAVPLLKLLGQSERGRFDTLEARANDGFVAQIPLALIAQGAQGGAVAWLAIEDPAQPWPPLPNRATSAGPFYLVWEHPDASKVRSEQWPHGLLSLTLVENPVHRWPQLELPAEHSADVAARSGQTVFLSLCLPCHRLNGGGASDTGPDLGQPMNATGYLTETGLRALIRNPRGVRSWPGQRMEGFGQKTLPEADLDSLLVYLRVMAAKPATNSERR